MNHIKQFLTSQINLQKSLINRPKSVDVILPEQNSECFNNINEAELICRNSIERLRITKFISVRWSKRGKGSDSHQYVAWATNTHPSTVKRTFNWLREQRLMFWDYIHMRPCNYRISKELSNPEFIDKISKALVVFGVFSVSLVSSKPSLAEGGLHLNNNDSYINTLSSNNTNARTTTSLKKERESLSLTCQKEKLLQKVKLKVPERVKIIDGVIRTRIALSSHDIAELCKYNMGTLNEAVRWLPYCLKADSPLIAFHDRCKKIAQKNNWPIDQELANRLRSALGSEDTERMLNAHTAPSEIAIVHTDDEAQPLYKPTPPPTPAPRSPAPKKDKPISTTELLAKQTKVSIIRDIDKEQDRARWVKIHADLIAKHGEEGPQVGSFEYFTWKLALKNMVDL